jgi:hypothetical protein
MCGNSTGEAKNSLKICGNSRGGGTKKWMSSIGGVWFKNAIAHLTLSLKYFINKYTLLESTSL